MTDHPLDNELEPFAVKMAQSDPRIALSVISELSAALSLKRIADELCGNAGHDGGARLGLVDALFEARARQ